VSELQALAASLNDAPPPNVLVLSGAGVSLASGIPTFRGSDPGAVWAENVTTLGTRAFFERDPVASWQFYFERFDGLGGKQPNPAHSALAALERFLAPRAKDFTFQGEFTLVTQNLDGLHRKAGSQAVVEIHGRADRVRCAERYCRYGAPRGWLPRAEVDFEPFRADPREATLPRCPECGAPIRAHLLWFDESYGEHEDYGYLQARTALTAAEVILVVGTSFSVGITQLVLQTALGKGIPLFLIDPGDPPDVPVHHRFSTQPAPALFHVRQPAEVALPQLCALLGIDAGG